MKKNTQRLGLRGERIRNLTVREMRGANGGGRTDDDCYTAEIDCPFTLVCPGTGTGTGTSGPPPTRAPTCDHTLCVPA